MQNQETLVNLGYTQNPLNPFLYTTSNKTVMIHDQIQKITCVGQFTLCEIEMIGQMICVDKYKYVPKPEDKPLILCYAINGRVNLEDTYTYEELGMILDGFRAEMLKDGFKILAEFYGIMLRYSYSSKEDFINFYNSHHDMFLTSVITKVNGDYTLTSLDNSRILCFSWNKSCKVTTVINDIIFAIWSLNNMKIEGVSTAAKLIEKLDELIPEKRKDVLLKNLKKQERIHAITVNINPDKIIDGCHLKSIWYDGEIATFIYRGYTIVFSARGDVDIEGMINGEPVNVKSWKNGNLGLYKAIGSVVDDKTFSILTAHSSENKNNALYVFSQNHFHIDLINPQGHFIDLSGRKDTELEGDMFDCLKNISRYFGIVDEIVEDEEKRKKEKTRKKLFEMLKKQEEMYGVTVKINPNCIHDDKHFDCLWYGGEVAAILYKGYWISIGANGDVVCKGVINGKKVEFKDTENKGRAYDEIGVAVDDEKLAALLESNSKNNYLRLSDCNWFEVNLTDSRGNYIDLSDQDNILENNIYDCLMDISRYFGYVNEAVKAKAKKRAMAANKRSRKKGES